MSRLVIFWITCSVAFLAGCIDPISLDTGDPDRRLVVEGLVREGKGPHYVNLSQSGVYAQGIDALRPAESGANVRVRRSDGSEVLFTESTVGYYAAPDGTLTGEVGESYTLLITLADGREYVSRNETIVSAPGIRDVRAELERYTELVNNSPVARHRVAFFVDAERDEDLSNYYRWTWHGYYAVPACYTQGGLEFCETCYRPASGSSLIQVASDEEADGPLLVGQRAAEIVLHRRTSLPTALPIGPFLPPPPIAIGLGFVYEGFFITVEQQALTAEAYNYWERARSQAFNVGSLFDPPPENLPTNMRNVNDATEVVLGFFAAVGISENRSCHQRQDFPGFPTPPPSPVSLRDRCHLLGGTTTPPPGYQLACSRE